MKKEKFIVYVVDDDEDDLEILSEAFEVSGCASEIKCFISGHELLDLMKLRKVEIPDIIIMDHYLSIRDETDMPGVIRSEKKNDNNAGCIFFFLIACQDRTTFKKRSGPMQAQRKQCGRLKSGC
jgi:CheY-like chemotaxis protein